MDEQFWLQRLGKIEYHQKLLIKIVNDPNSDFYKLVIEHGISEEEVHHFCNLCDELSIKMEEQKAEGFVYFHPLFHQLAAALPPNLEMKECLKACKKQGLYVPLMQELLTYMD